MELTYTATCTTTLPWIIGGGALVLNGPLADYIWVVTDTTYLSTLSVGQLLSSTTFGVAPYNTVNAPYKVGALVYINLTTGDVYTTPTAGAVLKGIIITDNDGIMVELDPAYRTDLTPTISTFCFYFPDNLVQYNLEMCFKISLWDLQCKFASCVNKYILGLQYGLSNCNTLEYLKKYKRLLELLNNYDTQDIGTGTKDHNNFYYEEVKWLMSKI